MIIRCGQIEPKLKSWGDPMGHPYKFILNRNNYFTLYPEDRCQLRF